MQHSILVLALIALTFTVHPGHSIKCYQCTSETDRDCLSPSKIVPTECSAETSKSSFNQIANGQTKTALGLLEEAGTADVHKEFGCVKFEISSGYQKVILRSCEDKSVISACEFMGSFQHGSGALSCNACLTDGCNGSSIPIPSIFSTFLLTIGAFVLTVLRSTL